jgi:hypothetical protein
VKEQKKKSKKGIIIVIIILLVIVVAAIGGIFAYQHIEENKSTGTAWGDKYYEYINNINNGEDFYKLPEKIENGEIQFIQLEENKDPIMTVKYKDTSKNELDLGIYYIRDDGEISGYTRMGNEEIKDMNLVLLYNRELEEFRWYEETICNDGQTSYEDVLKKINMYKETSKYDYNDDYFKSEEYRNLCATQESFSFNESEMSKEDEEEISIFEEKFIVPENVVGSEKVAIDNLRNLRNIKEGITTAVTGYKTEEEVTTEEVKENVNEKLEKIEQIKIAKEEAAKKAAEEEEAKKAAEEAAKGLKVGSHRLKYGTYKSDVTTMDSTLYGTITLNQDGTFHIKANCEGDSPYPTLNCDGTYKVGQVENSGSYNSGVYFTTSTGVKFAFEVFTDNEFSDQWHGYSYSGN